MGWTGRPGLDVRPAGQRGRTEAGPEAGGEFDAGAHRLSTFNGPLKGTCEMDPAENRVTVEGRGPDDLYLRLSVDYPSKAPFKVMLEGLGGGKGQIVGRVSTLTINRDNYVAAAGSGALDDATGASGRMRAEGFIKAGATMQAQNLVATIAWKCS